MLSTPHSRWGRKAKVLILLGQAPGPVIRGLASVGDQAHRGRQHPCRLAQPWTLLMGTPVLFQVSQDTEEFHQRQTGKESRVLSASLDDP